MGTENNDDAGVYKISDTLALVQTVDFFPPVVDDPFIYGEIAAANSLSDVYSMGGKPISCLNIVGFPDDKLPIEILGEILKGGLQKANEAHTSVLGGHSVRDKEIKFGLSVTGTVHPDEIITNANAKVGDVLILTKPIGVGILTSALKLKKIKEDGLQQAIKVMSELNEGAGDAMTSVGVNSATDITGFGLLGHAFEMATGANVTLNIFANKVPLLDDTMALAKKGCYTRAASANLAYLDKKLNTGNCDDSIIKILADAQTSGGLFISVSADKADQLIQRLNDNRTSCAEIIGEVTEKTEFMLNLIS